MSNPLTHSTKGRNVSPVKVQRSIPLGTLHSGIQDPSIRDAGTVMSQQRDWRTGQRTGPKFLRERVDAQQQADWGREYGAVVGTTPAKGKR